MADFLISVAREFGLVLVVGVVLGAGLPTLYALGIRCLAWGAGAGENNTAANPGPKHRVGRIIAYLIFTVVGLAVILGIAVIVASGFGIKIGNG